MDEQDETKQLREQLRADRKLIRRAEQVLAEIDRSQGLSDEHTDVLAALRIRLEGKKRASLDELLSATGEIGGRRDLGEVLNSGESSSTEWPTIQEKKKDWPGLS